MECVGIFGLEGIISDELIRRSENGRRLIHSSSFHSFWSSGSHQIWIAIVIGPSLKLRLRYDIRII